MKRFGGPRTCVIKLAHMGKSSFPEPTPISTPPRIEKCFSHRSNMPPMSYPQTPPYGAVVSLADHASMAMLEAPPSDRPITPDGDAMRDRQRSPAYSSLGGVVFENKLFGSLASVVPTILSP